jgi:serine/threonine protein phosphatase PrpC
MPRWRAMGKSIQGATHKRRGLPNQDAFAMSKKNLHWFKKGYRLTLAIADGHGSAKHFRSKDGARFAVAAANKELEPLLKKEAELPSFSTIKWMVMEQLPRKIVNTWKMRVEADLRKSPFKERECKQLEKIEGITAREAVKNNPFLAYGATVIVVMITEKCIIYLQLGDGDILAVSEIGEVTRPLSKDERYIANETASLCSNNPWNDFRVGFQIVSNTLPLPALILLSTDGYANSFKGEEEFLKVGRDIWELISSGGMDSLEANLEAWLTTTSQEGSGDDITLGVIWRMK